jgi:hypothetical protein
MKPHAILSGVPLFFVLISTLASFSAHAHEPETGKVTATLGPYFYKTDLPPNSALQPPVKTGFGLLVEGDVDYHGGLEFGLFYLQLPYYIQEGDKILAEKIKRMHITMGYRHWFSSVFSAGLSFFSSYSMGDYQVIRRDPLPSGQSATSAEDTAEYGFDASLQWEAWRDKESAVLVDGRYSYSVTSKPHERGNHYGLMIGYKHSIQVQ